jgi:hypothetical protein
MTSPTIRSACRQFVALCRNLNLSTPRLSRSTAPGSRHARDRSFSPGSIQRRMEQVEAFIERYL